ncbi:MAG: hypothetical protein IPN90_07955 [Elusimicrobia bacterium]|nr:hypothetical protein [Elusimicrobiota bacterium]
MSTAVSSVKKIRTFRLHARPSAVLRNLKALLDDAQFTPELEKAVESEILAASNRLDTAALFGTVTPAQSPPWMGPLWGPAPDEKPPVAHTVFVATIGAAFESELADALTRGEGLRSRLLTAIGEELADQAANFVERLVAEEARQESCELEERRFFSTSQDIQSALDLLEAGRLSIGYDAAGHLSPRFTRAGTLPWGPPAKKKK